ncbi:MAG: glycosyltransferase family 1 protein [Desulfobacterales bacterium]|nr:glycosyltransferase family 1 protein [Desulfobacterales bacterium]
MILDELSVEIATSFTQCVPSRFRSSRKIIVKKLPSSFLWSEKVLSDLSRQDVDLYISPYPKLPLFSVKCPTIHIIHDILYLTNPIYRKRVKVFFDTFRLKRALKEADLTWYDSSWSLKETRKYVSLTGANPKVRHLGISERFNIETAQNQGDVLKKYNLQPGYVLVIGNGLPHKNLGLLLNISDQIYRELVFVGVSQTNQKYWKVRHPHSQAIWIEYVHDENLPVIMKNAFCLAQPSKEEGYGYPPLEAMACGVPAVVSSIPVLVETTGNNVLVADPNDSYAWIEAFKSLENKSSYQSQVEKGLKWVKPLQGQAGWKGHIADIKEVLERTK